MLKEEKSHIYIAKGVLKNFVDENQKICYIKEKYKDIFFAYPKTFNTELGYYSNINEDSINKFSEDKFLRLINKLTKNINRNIPISLTLKDRITILKYLSYQILRNDYIYDSLNKKHKLKIPIKVIKNEVIKIEPQYDIVWNCVKNCNLQIMINVTKTKFLLPITSSIALNSSSKNDYILILFANPNIAFNIYPNKSSDNPIMEPINIIENVARDINLKILYMLKHHKNNKIIGFKTDLEKSIKSFIAKEKPNI